MVSPTEGGDSKNLGELRADLQSKTEALQQKRAKQSSVGQQRSELDTTIEALNGQIKADRETLTSLQKMPILGVKAAGIDESAQSDPGLKAEYQKSKSALEGAQQELQGLKQKQSKRKLISRIWNAIRGRSLSKQIKVTQRTVKELETRIHPLGEALAGNVTRLINDIQHETLTLEAKTKERQEKTSTLDNLEQEISDLEEEIKQLEEKIQAAPMRAKAWQYGKDAMAGGYDALAGQVGAIVQWWQGAPTAVAEESENIPETDSPTASEESVTTEKTSTAGTVVEAPKEQLTTLKEQERIAGSILGLQEGLMIGENRAECFSALLNTDKTTVALMRQLCPDLSASDLSDEDERALSSHINKIILSLSDEYNSHLPPSTETSPMVLKWKTKQSIDRAYNFLNGPDTGPIAEQMIASADGPAGKLKVLFACVHSNAMNNAVQSMAKTDSAGLAKQLLPLVHLAQSVSPEMFYRMEAIFRSLVGATFLGDPDHSEAFLSLLDDSELTAVKAVLTGEAMPSDRDERFDVRLSLRGIAERLTTMYSLYSDVEISEEDEGLQTWPAEKGQAGLFFDQLTGASAALANEQVKAIIDSAAKEAGATEFGRMKAVMQVFRDPVLCRMAKTASPGDIAQLKTCLPPLIGMAYALDPATFSALMLPLNRHMVSWSVVDPKAMTPEYTLTLDEPVTHTLASGGGLPLDVTVTLPQTLTFKYLPGKQRIEFTSKERVEASKWGATLATMSSLGANQEGDNRGWCSLDFEIRGKRLLPKQYRDQTSAWFAYSDLTRRCNPDAYSKPRF